ncbi:MAG: mannonate dehydratase, partial [Rhodocyclales bacterium]|nr:mannonate dehydratase [Rhodocyclales bacterium]
GSLTLSFDASQVQEIDPEQGIALPGWDASYKPEELKKILAEYKNIGEE